MKSASSKIALKPYLEAVKDYCEGLSKEELTETVLKLAQEVPVGGRKDFMDKFEPFMPRPVTKKKKKEDRNSEKKLLDRIEALKEDIEERISAIEDGTYSDYQDWDYDYDEEPDYVTEEQTEELEDIFLEVERFFLDSQLETAAGCMVHFLIFLKKSVNLRVVFQAAAQISGKQGQGIAGVFMRPLNRRTGHTRFLRQWVCMRG